MIQSSSFPLDETERLAAVDHLRLVGTPASPEFDDLLDLALDVTGCCAGAIGLMTKDRHWFKAERGLAISEMPRHLSPGNLALQQMEPLVIEDVMRDGRIPDPSWVVERGLRFYAGVALRDKDGCKVGTLSLMDRETRVASSALVDTIRHLGHVVEALVETHAQMAKATDLALTAETREREIWKKTHLIAQSERLAQVGAWEVDVATRTVLLSDTCCRFFGLEPGATADVDVLRNKFTPEERKKFAVRFKRCLKTGEGYDVCADMVGVDGTIRRMQAVVDVEKRDDRVVRLFGSLRDITEKHDAAQSLWRAAHFDALTGAPNRNSWTARLDQAVARAIADDRSLTILIFDLDGFKEINDTRGHAVGDIVLCELARRVGDTLPDGAFHARLGGDEFAVLLESMAPGPDVEAAVRMLLAAIQRPILSESLRLQVSGTFGSASFPSDAATASDLMQKADIALYQAKRSHRSSFVSFRSEIGDLFSNKCQAIDLVTAAIEQNRLVPFYQPKVELKSGRPIGFEALCRIEAADGTILGPSHFLPALEDSVAAERIGLVMLDLVTADIAAWHGDGLNPGRIALNVTSADFAKGDIAARVLGRLSALGLPAHTLEIELTENTILGREAQMIGAALQTMRDNGITIALDDFGTGYASLTHLRDAPIHYLKLDRSFIAGLGRSADSAIIVRSIVDLGQSLGMRIVAEGVETKGQADFLIAIGCNEAQGFLYGRPVSRAATRGMLEDTQRAREATRLRDPLAKVYFNFLSRQTG